VAIVIFDEFRDTEAVGGGKQMSKPLYKNVALWITVIFMALVVIAGCIVVVGIVKHLLGAVREAIERERGRGDIDGSIWQGGGMGIVGLSTVLSEIPQRQTAWGFSGCAAGLVAELLQGYASKRSRRTHAPLSGQSRSIHAMRKRRQNGFVSNLFAASDETAEA